MTATVGPLRVPDLPLFRQGKVRDTYDLGDRLLMVASDRISAFDVVLPTAIPGKGTVLTTLSRYWFAVTRCVVPNHLIDGDAGQLPALLGDGFENLEGRSMVVRRAERIDVECVVRGYLAGSAWTEYRDGGTIAGEPHPGGLQRAQRLERPVFTPALKNDAGHDQNVSRAELARRIGSELGARLEEMSLALYDVAAAHATARGIVVADTKFEFGFIDGELHLIDELLTPDSSRFWAADSLSPGEEPVSFDKQPVRDWLLASGWDRQPPGPELPPQVVKATQDRYGEALRILTGPPMATGGNA